MKEGKKQERWGRRKEGSKEARKEGERMKEMRVTGKKEGIDPMP